MRAWYLTVASSNQTRKGNIPSVWPYPLAVSGIRCLFSLYITKSSASPSWLFYKILFCFQTKCKSYYKMLVNIKKNIILIDSLKYLGRYCESDAILSPIVGHVAFYPVETLCRHVLVSWGSETIFLLVPRLG